MTNTPCAILAPRTRAAVGLVLAGCALAWCVLAGCSEDGAEQPPTVRLGENDEAVAELFDARQAPVAGEPGGTGTDTSAGAGGRLLRTPLDPPRAAKLFGQTFEPGGLVVHDPDTYHWERSDHSGHQRLDEHPRGRWTFRTNDRGCRQADDLAAEPPDLRILVTGDSHVAGVVPPEENLVAVLGETLAGRAPGLSVEGVNAAKGGFDFYNHVGVLDKFADVEADVVVLAVFAGNDFMSSVRSYRYFNDLPPMSRPDEAERAAMREVAGRMPGLVPQDLNQPVVFRRDPADVDHAARAAEGALVTFAEVCAERGAEFVLVLIPPCHAVQRDLLQPEFDDALERLGLAEDDLAVTGRLSDGLLARAAALGVTAIDMRPVFAASEAPCYWRSDLHINTRGHALVARELAAVLEPLLERGS